MATELQRRSIVIDQVSLPKREKKREREREREREKRPEQMKTNCAFEQLVSH